MSTKLSNKSKHPINVPLPGGKKIFLIPGNSAQVNNKAIDHPPLAKMIEAGDLEVDDGNAKQGGGSASAGTRAGGQGGGGSGGSKSNSIRRTGDR